VEQLPSYLGWTPLNSRSQAYSAIRFDGIVGTTTRDWMKTMPGPEYYHRQADLCLRMALSACKKEERVRLLHIANGYRDNAARVEALKDTIPTWGHQTRS